MPTMTEGQGFCCDAPRIVTERELGPLDIGKTVMTLCLNCGGRREADVRAGGESRGEALTLKDGVFQP